MIDGNLLLAPADFGNQIGDIDALVIFFKGTTPRA